MVVISSGSDMMCCRKQIREKQTVQLDKRRCILVMSYAVTISSVTHQSHSDVHELASTKHLCFSLSKHLIRKVRRILELGAPRAGSESWSCQSSCTQLLLLQLLPGTRTHRAQAQNSSLEPSAQKLSTDSTACGKG